MMNKRLYYLDAVRVLACFMVVFMHSPGPFAGQAGSGLFQSTLYYLTAPCIGLFFMVSGALLLPVREDASAFIRRRMTKILYPTFVWTGFYIVMQCGTGDYPPPQHVIRSILSVPFSPQGSGVLWFMYALTALYLVAPVISPWLCSASRRSVEIYLALWGITLCLPLLKGYVTIAQGVGSPLYYMSGYVGYFLLGYYMHRWPGSLRWRLLLPSLAVSLGAPVMCKLAGWQVDFYEVFWYLSIFVAVMCAVWFKVIRTLFDMRFVAGRRFPGLVLVSSLSFGIYLFHIFLLRDVLWHVPLLNDIDNYMLHTFTVAALTIVGSIAVTYVISLLPIGAYVVGCRNYLSSLIKPEKCN